MVMWNSKLWHIWTTLILICIWMWDTQSEEVELFSSDKQARLGWTSSPPKEWNEIQLRVGTERPVPVLQACGRRITRSILSPWMERKGAHYLLMDVAFSQEEEPSAALSPLQVHLYDTDTPIPRFQDRAILELHTSRRFPVMVPPNQISSYLNRSQALKLDSVNRQGFQVAFSYSGTCTLLTSIRLYYRRCPEIVAHLASFEGAGAGSGPLTGSCVKGAAEVSLPVRECDLDGVWGPLQGGCTCEPGYEVMVDTCQVCKMGYYKPANESGGCRLCPANSRTHREGSEKCDCLQGFSRLPTEPDHLTCTKPPSAPVNLTTHHHNDTVLKLMWDPPLDWGGREEVLYRVRCQKEAEAGSLWEACGGNVMFLPDSSGLTSTSVSIMGVDPQCGYRLSVQALNDVSSLQGVPLASTATLTLHRWKEPAAVITVTPGVNSSKHETTLAPHYQRHLSIWLTVCVLFVVLLLMATIATAVCVLCRNYTKLR